MDRLQLATIPLPDLVGAIRQLGGAASKLTQPQAAARLEIFILTCGERFHVFRNFSEATGLTLLNHFLIVQGNRGRRNEWGAFVRRVPTQFLGIRGCLYRMMMDPNMFDDRLLTLTPMMTYQTTQICDALVNIDAFPRNFFRTSAVPASSEVAKAYHTLQAMAEAHFTGKSVVVPTNTPYTFEWVVDIGRSGKEYPRIMFTMPPNKGQSQGDVWTTTPFGMRGDFPIPLLINGVPYGELSEIEDEWGTLRVPGIPSGNLNAPFLGLPLIAALINHFGAYVVSPLLDQGAKKADVADDFGFRFNIEDIYNLDTLLATYPRPELLRRLGEVFPSYVMRRTGYTEARALGIFQRNHITELYQTPLPLLFRVPPELWDPLPPLVKYGLPPPRDPHFFDGDTTPQQQLRRLHARLHIFPSSSEFYFSTEVSAYLGIPDRLVFVHMAKFLFDGLGETQAEASPIPATMFGQIHELASDAQLATALHIPHGEFYTREQLDAVMRRGYINPPLLSGNIEEDLRMFDALTDVQKRLFAAVLNQPSLTARDFIRNNIRQHPLYPLISVYSEAAVDTFVEDLPLLPPPHVRRTDYVEGQLPHLNFDAKTQAYTNTDAVLLAAAGRHIPYTHYEEIQPYLADMEKQRRFNIPFQRGEGRTVSGQPINDTNVFLVALESSEFTAWFAMTDLPRIVEMDLSKTVMDGLVALLQEAIDVLYYPEAATSYLRAIYQAFTHEDEALADAFIQSLPQLPPLDRRKQQSQLLVRLAAEVIKFQQNQTWQQSGTVRRLVDAIRALGDVGPANATLAEVDAMLQGAEQ